MRWDEFFRDLIAQGADLDLAERDQQVVELTQSAWAQIRWASLIDQRQVTLRVLHVGSVTGVVEQVTGAWVLVEAETVAYAIARDAVLGIIVGGPPGPRRASVVSERLGWGHAFRAFARDRDRVQVTRSDGSTLTATVRTVGADYVDLESEGGSSELVPFAAVVAVRCPLSR